MAELSGRKSPRLPTFDYTTAGAYFVTICTHQRRDLFGKVIDARTQLSEAGEIVEAEWYKTAGKRPYLHLDRHVVMPNHFHGIVILDGSEAVRDIQRPGAPRSLPAIIGGFKAASSRRIALLSDHADRPVWQRSYYDRIIRNDRDLHTIRNYIDENPARWEPSSETGRRTRRPYRT
jgi:REP-associated tyrosine transposase